MTESQVSKRSSMTTIIALLAAVQGAAGTMRALRLFEFGSDLMGQGLLILPMVGLVTMFRGVIIAAIALLYGVFAWGVLARWGWAWGLGLIVAGINVLLALSVMFQGESLARAAAWLIIPAIILTCLLSGARRQKLRQQA